ncbi:Spastin, partial [Aduncisulcus paluster]
MEKSGGAFEVTLVRVRDLIKEAVQHEKDKKPEKAYENYCSVLSLIKDAFSTIPTRTDVDIRQRATLEKYYQHSYSRYSVQHSRLGISDPIIVSILPRIAAPGIVSSEDFKSCPIGTDDATRFNQLIDQLQLARHQAQLSSSSSSAVPKVFGSSSKKIAHKKALVPTQSKPSTAVSASAKKEEAELR